MRVLNSVPSRPSLAVVRSSSRVTCGLSNHITSLRIPTIMSDTELTVRLRTRPVVQSGFSILAHYAGTFFIINGTLSRGPLVQINILGGGRVRACQSLNTMNIVYNHFCSGRKVPIITSISRHVLKVDLTRLERVRQGVFLTNKRENCSTALNTLLKKCIASLVISRKATRFLLTYRLPRWGGRRLPRMSVKRSFVS